MKDPSLLFYGAVKALGPFLLEVLKVEFDFEIPPATVTGYGLELNLDISNIIFYCSKLSS